MEADRPGGLGRWRAVGHEDALEGLRRAYLEGRLAHAYLLAGPRGVGKMTAALDMARLVNCVGQDPPCGHCRQCRRIERGLHADVRTVDLASPREGEGGPRTLLGIDQVREVQREAGLKPFEGRYRVFIIDQAERLSEAAGNALLKTLEEPPDQVLLLLLTTDVEALLPTIVSRCAVVELRPMGLAAATRYLQDRFGLEEERARELAGLSRGCLGRAIAMASDPSLVEERARRLETVEAVATGDLEERFAYARRLAASFARDREGVRGELELWLEWWRDVLLCREVGPEAIVNLSRRQAIATMARALASRDIAAAIDAVARTLDLLDRNVNPVLALEAMVLELPAPSQARQPRPTSP